MHLVFQYTFITNTGTYTVNLTETAARYKLG